MHIVSICPMLDCGHYARGPESDIVFQRRLHLHTETKKLYGACMQPMAELCCINTWNGMQSCDEVLFPNVCSCVTRSYAKKG